MKYLAFCLVAIQLQTGFGQTTPMRSLEELVNREDPGWRFVEEWIEEATNQVEVLKRDAKKADAALYQTQVTTRSPMGAIIYETGGILVDHGWIRILGSGSAKMTRSLPEWNKGKLAGELGQGTTLLLIADDAIGGYFALNGGAFGNDLGKVYYFSPDNLEWEPLDVGYSEFVYWAFTGDLEQFYEGLRWNTWRKEVSLMDGDQVVHFFPYLWTEYEDLEKLSRKAVPVEEMWNLQMDLKNQLFGN
ncbi:Protein of unknown function DUF2625 [Catalinimonas alkaloidigena]|uniref:DUF2625 domain-containing protein n=1 Tax=Catalinimonas alkaloidigena TaxID=1075417 RepID=A0A1G9QBD7_9BACT|nr:DUF2625 domain-containing protein [Catalinimonas alkaloidigena]SDM08394.1 Protein of unknown function DUF2625 [Catalinimonas alkaloidigena]